MNTYLILPPSGGQSPYYAEPVANFADLPANDTTGALRLVSSEGTIYFYDGDSWQPVTELLTQTAVTDTDSVDLTVTDGVLAADLKLSATGASGGNLSPALLIEADGVRSELPISDVRALFGASDPISYDSSSGEFSMAPASGSADGYLDAADFAVFAAKEPAVTAGTSTQYYRGDKTFATLNTAALVANTDGSAAAVGGIGEVIFAAQSASTDTGVGASGAYGSVVSITLTPGIWQVRGTAGFHPNGATLSKGLECGLSAAADGAGISEFDTTVLPFMMTSNDAVFSTPVVTVAAAVPTACHLNTRFFYSAGSPQHRGKLVARRVR